MSVWIWIGVGGFGGVATLARFLLDDDQRSSRPGFSYGTLVV